MAKVCEPAVAKSQNRASRESEREPHLFRFGLRQFFGFVSGTVMLLGAMAYIRGGWSMGLGFLAALIAAHVLATFVGTRLRDSSAEVQRWAGRRLGGALEGVETPPQRGRLTSAELAAFATPPLAKHERAPLRTLLAAVSGLAAGGFLGAVSVPLIAGPEAIGAGIALGAASCAVMGAWLALLAAHFWSVARRAWSDANTAGASAKGAGKQVARGNEGREA